MKTLAPSTPLLRGEALLERVLAIPFRERDAWLDALLGVTEPLGDDVLPRESVPYVPCGVDEMLAAVREVPIRADDEFVDLGSGVGRVAMFIHLLTGARALGIEIQAPLVRLAVERSAALMLNDVSFVHANAAEVELRGSVFFLYAPFNGDMLSAVLRRLEAVAHVRPIVLCAVDLALPGVSWLRARATSSVALTVYDSCMPGVRLR